MSFALPIDIMNRACQHLGVSRLVSLSDDTMQSSELQFAYDKIRRAELRRNVWRFATRQACIRPLTQTTVYVTPAAWSGSYKYFPGHISADTNGIVWQSQQGENLNNAIGASQWWDIYFGPLTADVWDSSTSYFAGEMVYIFNSTTINVYLSIINGNTDTPTTGTAWSATTQYQIDDDVIYNGTLYRSSVSENLGNQPDISSGVWYTDGINATTSVNWIQLNSATTTAAINVWPIGTGPLANTSTNNVYRLPANFLREAPLNPKAGSTSFLGASWNLPYDDWTFEGNFLITSDSSPIIFRFVADVQYVPNFDDMFCEGLGARLAEETCERITQSTTKLANILKNYDKFMLDARLVNGIETGPTEPQEDDWITCRQ